MREKIILLLLVAAVLAARFSEAQVWTGPILMNASVPLNFIQVSLSNNLAEGIHFTTQQGAEQNVVYPLLAGSSGNNATFNYNSTDLKTEYWIHIAGMMVDICNGAKYNLCSNLTCAGPGNVEIAVGNVSWSDSLSNSAVSPSYSGRIPVTVGYDNANKIAGVNPGSYVYLRYWQSVPSNFPAYNYSTVYQIQVIPAGGSCG